MSRIATSTDNPVLESINGWIKDELMFDFNMKHSEYIQQTIKDYVKYYNEIRTAYTLKYKNPVQYRTEQLFKEIYKIIWQGIGYKILCGIPYNFL